MLVLWFNMEAVLLALNQHPDVAALAEVYLRWLSIGLPGYAGNVALKKCVVKMSHHKSTLTAVAGTFRPRTSLMSRPLSFLLLPPSTCS